MRDIDAFFMQRPRSPLYHYTSMDTLQAIVNSRVMFASHAYFLNDSKELLHGCAMLRDEISTAKNLADKETTHFLNQMLKWLDTFDHPRHIFVASLSERWNQLSQWRGYTSGGKGVSIGFPPERIVAMLSLHHRLRIAKCVYYLPQQRHMMSALLGLCMVTFGQVRDNIDLSKEHPDNRYFNFLEQFREEFLQVMAIIKHPAFEEEAEWRLISPYYPNLKHEHIHHRAGPATLIPYIKLNLAPDDEKPAPLFQEVWLGPSRHPNLAMHSLSSFLSSTGACNSLKNSGTPYREW